MSIKELILSLNLMAISLSIGLEGLAGLTLGLFTVAAFAGYTGQTVLEPTCNPSLENSI